MFEKSYSAYSMFFNNEKLNLKGFNRGFVSYTI